MPSLLTTGHLLRCIIKPPLTHRFSSLHRHYCNTSENDDTEAIFDEEDEPESMKTIFNMPDCHGIVVIQPNVRYGNSKTKTWEAKLLLDESIALLETLDKWKVLAKRLSNCDGTRGKYVLRPGNLRSLAEEVKESPGVTAVYMGVNVLSGMQKINLEELLGVPVYDRYSVVLEIFKQHAKTPEAKLQIALAQIPYIRKRINNIRENTPRPAVAAQYIGGSGEAYISQQLFGFQDREKRILKALAKIKQNRALIRESRKRSHYPTIAVVGYTNCGKTSVIQALTHDESLKPRNQLFATVDVTTHAGTLGKGYMDVLYIDTVGFISNIPTTLVASFSATLEDAVKADILLHVSDISHISHTEQRSHVVKTLQSLNASTNEDAILNAFNKIDKTDGHEDAGFTADNDHYVSALHGTGMEELKSTLEQKVMEVKGREEVTFKIPIAAPHWKWLQRYGNIVSTETYGTCGRYYIVSAILGEVELMKFEKRFGNLRV